MKLTDVSNRHLRAVLASHLGVTCATTAFERYHDACVSSADDRKARALEKMCEVAQTFHEWRTVWCNASGADRLRALEKLCALAQTFDEWLIVWMYSTGEQKKVAHEKLSALAQTFSDWRKVWEYTLTTEDEEFVLQKLSEFITE